MTLRRAEGLTVEEMEGDLFVVRPDGGEIYHMDQMAAAIWHAVERHDGRADLHVLFRIAFPETDPLDVSRDLDAALSVLLQEGLLVETVPDSS